MEPTFEQLPKAISQLFVELKEIKTILSQDRITSSEETQLLTVQEAAEYLNLAAPTIYALVSKKEIPFMKAAGGRRLYFLKKELADWVISGRQKTISEISAEATKSVGRKRRRG